MYLSRLMLNLRNPKVARDIHDICHMHRTVMSVFSDVEVPREPRSAVSALYRVEMDRGAESASIIIQSAVKPDWNNLPEGYALQTDAPHGQNPATKCMHRALSDLSDERVLRFRLRANASRKVGTKSGPDGRRRNGRRVPLRSNTERMEWLRRKADQSGFRLVEENASHGSPAVSMSSGERRTGRRRRRILTIESVQFEGLLEVMDTDKFISAICTGIGPGKPYGCGLLSVARIRAW